MPWYEYTQLSGIPRPLARVLLWHGNRRVPLIGLIDSGADASLLDAEYASFLGLDPSDALRTTSTGAEGEAFETLSWPNAPLEVQFRNERFPFRGSFFEFPAGHDGMNLLGRRDFFARYVVQFWESESIYNIDLSPDLAEGPLSP